MKIKYFLFLLVILVIPHCVYAAPSASISTSSHSIESGKSVNIKVTLTDTAAWNIKITGSGAATCSSKQADVTPDAKSTTKTFDLSCTSVSEGVITINVLGDITSDSGETKDISLSSEVIVTKPKSSDNSLADLKVDGISVYNFSSSKTMYTLKDNSGTNVIISASPNDSKASISGTGNKELKYGQNTFNVIVTAENGSKKTYTIVINKPDSRSNNNDLKNLIIDKGEIAFDKNVLNYTIKLENDIERINITATADDSKATVKVTGEKILKDYINEFKVIVTAENGSVKTYTIKAIRKDKNGNYRKLSEDNSVKSINIKNYDINFDEKNKSYNLLVEDIDNLDIDVIPNDSTATVIIKNNDNLKCGLNKISIQIIAENDNINEYNINVYKMCDDDIMSDNNEIEIDNKCEQKNKFNIWIVLSLIQFLVIITILLVKFKKNV